MKKLTFPTISVKRDDKGWVITRDLACQYYLYDYLDRDPMEDENFWIKYDKVFLNSIPNLSLELLT
jgi:hypothetical protein